MSTTTTRDPVLDVWNWCQEIYLQQGGIQLRQPQGTAFHKTYQYRYAHKLAGQFTKWEFDEPTSRRFIEVAVSYGRAHKLLHKGLAMLHQGNLMELMYKLLQQEQKQSDSTLTQLERTRDWVCLKIGEHNPVNILTARTRPDAYCNLVKWYGERQLSDLYLALSASCGAALAKLTRSAPGERQEVPNQSRLYLTRLSFLQDQNNLREAKRIMGGDWRQCP